MPDKGSKSPVVRFAPSPNGRLHLGHARSALINHEFARTHEGTMLLRIEDIDRERCKPEFEDAIFSDLAWLGLKWPEPVLRQSDRFARYSIALDELRQRGLIYPAFLSRSEIRTAIDAFEKVSGPWPRDPDGAPHYPGHERDLDESERAARIATGRPFAWRLDMARALAAIGQTGEDGEIGALTWDEAGEGDGPVCKVAADPAAWGDVILARRDTPASYHLSVVLDDHDQGVTDVIRGNDLYAATSIHRLLQELLGLVPPTYRHHRLVTDTRGRKLAKSDDDISLAALRSAGRTQSDIRRMAGIDAPLVPFAGLTAGARPDRV